MKPLLQNKILPPKPQTLKPAHHLRLQSGDPGASARESGVAERRISLDASDGMEKTTIFDGFAGLPVMKTLPPVVSIPSLALKAFFGTFFFLGIFSVCKDAVGPAVASSDSFANAALLGNFKYVSVCMLQSQLQQ